MRLAFWRAGRVGDVVQRAMGTRESAVSTPVVAAPIVKAAASKPAVSKPVAAKPAAATESGDLDLHALGRALVEKRSLIIVPTLLVAIMSIAAVNMVTPRYKSEARILVDGR